MKKEIIHQIETQIDTPNNKPESKISRRELLRQAMAAGFMFALPWHDRLQAQSIPLPNTPIVPPNNRIIPPKPNNKFLKPPMISFKSNKMRDGIIGPYGEARIYTVNSEPLPVLVTTIDGLAVMDMTGRIPYVRYGTGTSSIMLTSEGVQFGKAPVIPWNKAAIKKLLSVISQDRNLIRSALLLRSAIHSAYPVAVAESNSKLSEKSNKAGSVVAASASSYGWRVLECTTTTVIETVIERITETVEVIKTAFEQYQDCYNQEVNRNPCKEAGFGLLAGPCAAGICAANAYIDMVTGFITIVTEVPKEVTREVINCVEKPLSGNWPNPWDLIDPPKSAAVPQPMYAFSAKDINNGVKLLKVVDILGKFGMCLINGNWSLAQLNTRINLDGGPIMIPYGIKVCIDAECAEQLSADQIGKELLDSWNVALSVLAELSPDFAREAARLGIAPIGGAIGAVIAAAPPVVASAAALILAFIVLALIYGTAIFAQLFLHRKYTNNFSDGTVCIEHATFALALIKIAMQAPSELIPPIVTG